MNRRWNPTAQARRSRRRQVLAVLGSLLYFAVCMVLIWAGLIYAACTAPTMRP